jgi:LysM repeat protein
MGHGFRTIGRHCVAAALAGVLLLGDLGAVVAASPPTYGVPAVGARAAGPSFHVVKPGDTLRSIATLRGVRLRDLAAWNGIGSPYRVYVDGVLRLTAPAVALPRFATRVEVITATEPPSACPVRYGDLRRIWVSYIDFNGTYRDGAIIMNKRHTARTQAVFRALYHRRFRIQAMVPLAVNMRGWADWDLVTSGYACRKVGGSRTWSQHAYGNAIDINPGQNPMIRNGVIEPIAGGAYVKRGPYRRGMVHAGGAVTAFTANGFPWGGRWHSLKDYMHFSTTNR